MIILEYESTSTSIKYFNPVIPKRSMQFRIYQSVFVLIAYIKLMAVGCMLLKQVTMYSTEKPYRLIIALLAFILDFTFDTIFLVFMMNSSYLNNPVIL